MENAGQPMGASPVTVVTAATDGDATSPGPSPTPADAWSTITEGEASPMTDSDVSPMLNGVNGRGDGGSLPPDVGDRSPPPAPASEGRPEPDGASLAAPETLRIQSAPHQSAARQMILRSPEVSFRRSECRSAGDMMMGTRQCRRDLTDYFSTMDPSQFHFYDFGIQDFLVMKSHQNVDMSHEDDEVQHGDYNIGMNVAPGPYLSDSDLSVTSIELSPAQVLWEKKLLDDTSILRNCLLKRGRRQATAAQEATRIKLQGLRRRATELCFGHQQRTKSIGGRKILSRPLSVTEMGIDDSGLRSRQSSLDVGDDCTTIARPSLDFTDEDMTRDRSSQNSGDSGCDHREPEDADLTT